MAVRATGVTKPSKVDGLRAMRERNFAAAQTKKPSAFVRIKEGLEEALESVRAMPVSQVATVDNTAVSQPSTYKGRDPETRRAYQREYMKKRRAKKKAGN